MTRNEFKASNVSPMGTNPRLRRLVPRARNAEGAYVDSILDRVRALKNSRLSSKRSLTSEERIALAGQSAQFAALLARLPTPRLP